MTEERETEWSELRRTELKLPASVLLSFEGEGVFGKACDVCLTLKPQSERQRVRERDEHEYVISVRVRE